MNKCESERKEKEKKKERPRKNKTDQDKNTRTKRNTHATDIRFNSKPFNTAVVHQRSSQNLWQPSYTTDVHSSNSTLRPLSIGVAADPWQKKKTQLRLDAPL